MDLLSTMTLLQFDLARYNFALEMDFKNNVSHALNLLDAFDLFFIVQNLSSACGQWCWKSFRELTTFKEQCKCILETWIRGKTYWKAREFLFLFFWTR